MLDDALANQLDDHKPSLHSTYTYHPALAIHTATSSTETTAPETSATRRSLGCGFFITPELYRGLTK